MVIVGVAYALPQLLIPTSVSHQSGIIRNIPTTLIGVPLNNVWNDRDRAAIVTQLQIDQWIQDRLSNNNNNQNRNIQDQINREIAIQSQQRRLNDQLNDQIRTEQVVRNAEQLRNEQIRDELDRTETTRRLLQQTSGATTGLTNAQLRTAVTGRLI